jgi:hypothetical protein
MSTTHVIDKATQRLHDRKSKGKKKVTGEVKVKLEEVSVKVEGTTKKVGMITNEANAKAKGKLVYMWWVGQQTELTTGVMMQKSYQSMFLRQNVNPRATSRPRPPRKSKPQRRNRRNQIATT